MPVFEKNTWATTHVPKFCDPCGVCGGKCDTCGVYNKKKSEFKLIIPVTSPIVV